MKIEKLSLLRFGPFTDLILDFASDGKNLHVIFGSNEAGKSTILRAVLGFLFGIPETTLDDHVHKKSALRIGAHIETADGRVMELIRRKGRKNTLLTTDERPIDETEFMNCLGGVGRELFEVMFGLSHEVLVQGGHELLEGKGELGESLFSAGTGLLGFHRAHTSLRDEVNAIFTPRSHTLPLNAAIKKFKDKKKQIAELSLKPRAWKYLQEKLEVSIRKLKDMSRELETASAELTRLNRLQRTLPLINKREELQRRLSELGEVSLIAESSSEERRQALQILDSSDIREKRLRSEQAEREEERRGLVVPETLLHHESEIMDLRDHAGAHKKAMQDLPDLQTKIEASSEEAKGILRKMGREVSLDKADQLRVDSAVEARIRALARERERIDAELKKGEKDVCDVKRKLDDLKDRYSELPEARDPSQLRRLVAEAWKRGDLGERLRNLEIEIKGLAERAEKQLTALTLWQGLLGDVGGLPLPSAETVERFDRQFSQLERERDLAAAERDRLSESIKKLSTELAELQARGTIPTEKELEKVRKERNGLWQRIRSVWIEGNTDEEETPEVMANRYESGVVNADEVSDRLRYEAERVAKHSTISATKRQDEDEHAEINRRLQDLSEESDKIKYEWQECWSGAGIEPLMPEEMKAWLSKHERLLEAVEGLKSRQHERDALREEIAENKSRCSRELVALGEPDAGKDETLSMTLDRADMVIGSLNDVTQERKQTERDIEEMEKSLKQNMAELEDSQKELREWKTKWANSVQTIGLDKDALTEEAEAILGGLTRLFQKVDEIRSVQIRISHIEEDARAFSGEVSALALACAPDIEGMAPDKAASELIRRFDKGKEDQSKRQSITNRLQQLDGELEELESEREAAQATLKRLMESVACNTIEELEEAERRSREYEALKSKIDALEEQLLTEGGLISELVKQAQTADPDKLPGEIQKTEERISDIRQERDHLQEEIGRIKKELEGMDGGSAAADAASEADEALSEIKSNVESYVRLKLAALLLDREIERYREEHQGPILERAGEVFSQLTLGAFSGLTTGFGSGDQLVLVCVRNNGERVPMEGLSHGTRDQLYLSLRLASLEQHMMRNEPLPLVVDDVLINFDDRRAEATLKLLGKLSEKTQILFFTHHAKLLEIAKKAVPSDIFREHDLDAILDDLGIAIP